MKCANRLFGWLARGVLAVLLSAAGMAAVVAPGSPAFAACSGTGCNGLDPSSSGCSATGSTVAGSTNYQSSFGIEQRRSSGCKARWTRLTIDDATPTCCVPINIRIQRQLKTPYGWYDANVYTKKVAAGKEGQFWTPMVGDTSDDRTRSCWGLNTSSTDWCSGWF